MIIFLVFFLFACANEVQTDEESEIQNTEIIEEVFYPEGLYEEDGKNIYWNGNIVEKADPKTFQGILDPNDKTPEDINDNDFYFFKDENALYMSSGPFGGNATLGRYAMESTDNLVLPKGMLLYLKYVIEGNSVYYLSDKGIAVKIPDADLETFEEIDGDGYVRDKNHIYFCGKTLKEADVKTFSKLGERSSVYRDKENAYYHGRIIEEADSKTFQTIRNRHGGICYYKDKNYVYWSVQPVPKKGPTVVTVEGADPETFECVNTSHEYDGKDKDYFYKNGKIKIFVPEPEDELVNLNS